ncbi:MAG: YggT family protein [Gemmatimonadales bacterium]
MVFAALVLASRVVVIIALAYASAIALTHWAVRSRRLTPFGAWPRFMRRASDPVLLPLERRIVRSGGSPQDAPLWLVGIVIVGGLLLLSLVQWLAGFAVSLEIVAQSGPRGWGRFLVSGLFTVVMIAVFVRVISSWFGISPYRPWMRPVMLLTDWIINPIRRILPPFGMIDFSPVVAWLVLSLVRGFLLSLM